jgi:hypothetical protein
MLNDPATLKVLDKAIEERRKELKQLLEVIV